MIEFEAREFFGVLNRLISVRKWLEDKGHPPLTEQQRIDMHGHADRAELVCAKYDIDVSYYTDRLRGKIDNPDQYTFTVASAVNDVRHCINNELRKRKFMYMPDPESGYYDQQDLYGSEVSQRFPSANREIRIAGNCYATGNYTACVFHLTRALERALFVLVQDPTLGITIVDSRLETWETLINKIESWLLTLQKAPNTTPNKKVNLETYSGPALQFRYFKDHWRNPISHGRASYDGPQALSALGKVRDLMDSLAEIPGLQEEPGMITP